MKNKLKLLLLVGALFMCTVSGNKIAVQKKVHKAGKQHGHKPRHPGPQHPKQSQPHVQQPHPQQQHPQQQQPQPQPHPYPLPQPYLQPYPVPQAYPYVGVPGGYPLPQPGGGLPQQQTGPINQPGGVQQQPQPLTMTATNNDQSSEESVEAEQQKKKVFQQIQMKFNWKVEHVQKKHGETPPTDEVKHMVQKHASQIKNRAQLPVVTDEDRADLNAAPVDALSVINYQDGDNEIYLVKVIIGNQFIVHVKIAAKRLLDKTNVGASIKPDVEQSVVMLVLPDKEEQDKLSKEEFDNPPKPVTA